MISTENRLSVDLLTFKFENFNWEIMSKVGHNNKGGQGHEGRMGLCYDKVIYLTDSDQL